MFEFRRHLGKEPNFCWTSLVAQTVKNPPAMWETWVRFLGQEDPLEDSMATHSSILDWESHGQRILAGYSPWGPTEPHTIERLSTSAGKKDAGPQEGTCLIWEAVCLLLKPFVVCLCVLTSYGLWLRYLTIRFTYFLNWLLLALFPGPKPFLLLFGSITDIYKLPWRTQSITTIDAHCSKRVDLYPWAPIKIYCFLPLQCLL